MIFRMSDAEETLTPQRLAEFIGKNDAITGRRYKRLRDAYCSDYAILRQKPKADYKPDNRIAVNFAKYIVDVSNGFSFGIPIKLSSDDDRVSEYINWLDAYNDQDNRNAELAKMMKIYGRAYELCYVDEAGKICLAHLDPMEAFMIYDESLLERPRYFVRTYRDVNGIRRGSVSDAFGVWYFRCDPEVVYETDPAPHGFDGVPAIEYVENNERTGLFEPVMSLIDAYNKAVSEKANDVDYFADAYLKVLGAVLNDEELTSIRDNRVINFPGEGSDLVVEFLEKPNGDESQEHLIDRLERLIFQISMTANISEEDFGAASGIALKYRLQAMSDVAKTEERKFTAGMNRRYRLIFSHPLSGMDRDAWTTIRYKFSLNYPANELEESQIAGNLAGITSRETQLRTLSVVEDVDEELARIEEETAPWTDGYEVNRVILDE